MVQSVWWKQSSAGAVSNACWRRGRLTPEWNLGRRLNKQSCDSKRQRTAPKKIMVCNWIEVNTTIFHIEHLWLNQ
jgi:hypothetical protein